MIKVGFLAARALSQPRFIYRQDDSGTPTYQPGWDQVPQYFRFNDLNTLSIELAELNDLERDSLSLAESLALTDYSDNNFSHVYSRIQSEYII